MRQPEIHDLAVGLGAGILVLLIGILVDRALDILDLGSLIIAVAISVLIILGIVAIVWGLGRSSYESKLESLLHQLREASPSAKYDWLYTPDDMIELEETITCRHIWIVSPDLSYDTGTPSFDFSSLLQGNLRRGITYTYIVPDTEEIRAVLPHLIKVFSTHPRQLQVVQLPREAFETLTIAHTSVYDPLMERGRAPEVFIELPISIRGYGNGFWVKAASDISYRIVGRLHKIVESYTGDGSSKK